MTTNETFDRRLSDWLEREAEHRVPDHLDTVLVRTVATRQRPWWSSPERWLPMDVLASTRTAPMRPVAMFLLLAALLLTLVATAIVASGVHRLAPSFALPDNGRIYVADAGSLASYAADGSDRQVVAELPSRSRDLSFSPDGRSLAFIADSSSLAIVDADDGSITPLDIDGMVHYAGPIIWAPDGERFLVNTASADREHLYIVPRDGSEARELAPGQTAPGHELVQIGWSPQGDLVAFAARGDPGTGQLYVVEGDGPPRLVGDRFVDQYSASWSPDRAVRRLLYTTASQEPEVRIVDLDEGTDLPVLTGRFPVWSPDGSKIALWSEGTRILTTEAVLAGTPDPTYLFAAPSHTKPGMAPLPGRFRDCSNPDALSGTEICEPVRWSPDGALVYGPELSGGAIVIDRVDGSGTITTIPVTGDRDVDVAWRPLAE